MGLFGSLFGRKRSVTKTVDDLKKDNHLLPFVKAVVAAGNGDFAEFVAATAKPMECWECGHQATVGEFIHTADGFVEKLTGGKVKRHGIMTKCPNPKCDADPILVLAREDD